MLRVMIVLLTITLVLVASGCVSNRDDPGAADNETDNTLVPDEKTPLGEDFADSGNSPSGAPPEMPDLPN